MRDYPLPDFELYDERELHMHSVLSDEQRKDVAEVTETSTADNLSQRLAHWLGIMNR